MIQFFHNNFYFLTTIFFYFLTVFINFFSFITLFRYRIFYDLGYSLQPSYCAIFYLMIYHHFVISIILLNLLMSILDPSFLFGLCICFFGLLCSVIVHFFIVFLIRPVRNHYVLIFRRIRSSAMAPIRRRALLLENCHSFTLFIINPSHYRIPSINI